MAAVSLSACGGDDSSEGSDATTRPQTARVDGEAAAAGDDSADSDRGSTGSRNAPRPAPTAPKEWAPAERAQYERERYGPPSQRSAGFRGSARQGTLKHIPEFGNEAAASQRGAAQATLTAYLAAAGVGDWPEACRYLLPYYVNMLKASSGAGAGAGASSRDCPEALGALYEETANQPGPRYPDGGNPQVTSFRVETYPDDRAAKLGVEEAGFALLHGSDGIDYYVSMTREEGRWTITVPAPRPLSG